jgi:DNA-directed RNA polymerase specialized sigma24 family protein
MGKEEIFDSFYRTTRQGLLHQTLALTGDLTSAQSAVRDAYVAAWHHWRKVSRLEDPQDWVRPRAWQLAQHRHTAKLWHRSRGLSEEHRSVLDALARLPAAQRRALLLVQLAGLPLQQAARELGVTLEVLEQNLQSATANLAAHLDIASTAVRGRLDSLADAVQDAALPRPSIIRRAGRKRRQAHTLVGAAAVAVVAVGSGALAYAPHPGPASDLHLVQPGTDTSPTSNEPDLPTAANLLDQDQVRRLGLDQPWHVLRTHNNTSGTGINSVCQQQRFADPDGLSALVRTFEADGKPSRSAVQTVEISRTEAKAEAGYRNTVDWFAGCQVSRLQLLNAYRVDHIGDEASVLMVRVWDRPVTTYSVAVARVGTVTTSTVAKTVGGQPAPPAQITQSLADAVAMLCSRSGAADCAKQPSYQEVPPPPSGREQGVLAVADLPPVGRIDRPWVATDPVAVRRNPSATTCDRADFAKAGSTRTMARTYLIPQAKLPARFGLSETYGDFGSPTQAARFLARVRGSFARCEDRDLATNVTSAHSEQDRSSGTDLSTWDLETEVSTHEKVRFRVGFVRVADKVAQLTFAPAPRDDMSSTHFHDLVVRAGDRLRELG